MGEILIGTCSWNYDSWKDIVYSKPCSIAAEYLEEYSQHFTTAEIDSWFYKMPSKKEVLEYKNHTHPNFRFTCKLLEDISLTHKRYFKNPNELIQNNHFLSVELFNQYIEAIEVLLPQIDCIMLEFEYLNKDKMESIGIFLDRLDTFITAIDRTIPIGVEVRNKNYLTPEYFKYLLDNNIVPVLCEKQYMPHIYDVYDKYKEYFGPMIIERLLGGDRKEIEQKTGMQWNKIVDEKQDKQAIANISLDMKYKGKRVIINVNNHYEGSAPLTIEAMRLFGL